LFGWSHKVIQEVHWHGEDDGGVVLGSDTAQGLKVPELQLQSSGDTISEPEKKQIWVTREPAGLSY